MLEKVKYYGTKAALALASAGTALSAVAVTSSAEGAGGSSWISSIDVTPITDSITTAIPIIMPALISILAIRKGVSFVLGLIHRA